MQSESGGKTIGGVCSMTGFGRSEMSAPGVRISIEIRSVNNRFCEIGMKLARELNALEGDIRDRIRGRIARGKISLLISLTHDGEEAALQIDAPKARACYAKLQELNRALGHEAPVTLGQLLHFSDYFTQPADIGINESAQALMFAALDAALDDLVSMRCQEGAGLAADLLNRQLHIEALLADIERLALDQPQMQLAKLKERLESLVSSGPIDPGRLEAELALAADRLDVSEECVRLHSHGRLLRQVMTGREPAGKKLGFLLQEMQREVNTISSKSALAEIAHLAVGIKEEIEKMREQVQNLE
jgi:uncharacterized protein (TIGR00255 family)